MIYAFIAFSILVILVLILIFRIINDLRNELTARIDLIRNEIDIINSADLERLYNECKKFDDKIKSLEIGKTILVERINKLESYIVYTSEGFKSDILALKGHNELIEHGYERVNSDILYLIGMIEALARADEVKEAYKNNTICEISTKLFGNPNFIEDNWDLLYKNYCEEINEDDDEEDQ